MATLYNFFFFSLCIISVAAVSESAHRFRVGGPRGWVEPAGNESKIYNQWAVRNRFHIGDSLSFEYTNDSVVVVDEDDYNRCSSSNPISKFDDGNTVFEFSRGGFYYFISGVPAHCKAGQKMIALVMGHHSTSLIPAAAPEPWAGGEGGGGAGQGSYGPSSRHPTSSSAVKVTLAAYSTAGFMAALGGMMFICFLV